MIIQVYVDRLTDQLVYIKVNKPFMFIILFEFQIYDCWLFNRLGQVYVILIGSRKAKFFEEETFMFWFLICWVLLAFIYINSVI